MKDFWRCTHLETGRVIVTLASSVRTARRNAMIEWPGYAYYQQGHQHEKEIQVVKIEDHEPIERRSRQGEVMTFSAGDWKKIMRCLHSETQEEEE